MSQYVLTQMADKTSVLRQGTPAPAHWFISTRVFSCVDPILMHILLYYSDLFHSGFAVTMCVKERRYSRGLAREEAGIPLLGQLSLHSMVRQNPEVFYGEFALAMCVKSNQRRLVKWYSCDVMGSTWRGWLACLLQNPESPWRGRLHCDMRLNNRWMKEAKNGNHVSIHVMSVDFCLTWSLYSYWRFDACHNEADSLSLLWAILWPQVIVR